MSGSEPAQVFCDTSKKYYVASDGEEPLQLFFCDIDAFASGYRYLDLFNESGILVNSFKFINDEYVEKGSW